MSRVKAVMPWSGVDAYNSDERKATKEGPSREHRCYTTPRDTTGQGHHLHAECRADVSKNGRHLAGGGRFGNGGDRVGGQAGLVLRSAQMRRLTA
jgi:hypothetical protein